MEASEVRSMSCVGLVVVVLVAIVQLRRHWPAGWSEAQASKRRVSKV